MLLQMITTYLRARVSVSAQPPVVAMVIDPVWRDGAIVAGTYREYRRR